AADAALSISRAFNSTIRATLTRLLSRGGPHAASLSGRSYRKNFNKSLCELAFAGGNRGAIGADSVFDHVCNGKVGADALLQQAGVGSHPFRMVNAIYQSLRKYDAVTRCDEEIALRSEDFGNAADIGGNQRFAGSGYFQHDIG